MKEQIEYLNALSDYGFKKLFGARRDKDLLIDFLNAIFEGKKKIRDVISIDKEQKGRTKLHRDATFDIYCESIDGEKILIEMQKAFQDFFMERIIYYSTFPIQEQAPKGEWNYEIKEVYVICLLNFTLDDDVPDHPVQWIELMNPAKGKVICNKLKFAYIELPKFIKKEEEIITRIDKWLYFLLNLPSFRKLPAILKDPIFKRAFEIAKSSNLNTEDMFLTAAQRRKRNEWDIYSIKQTAERIGREEGLAAGHKEGHKEGHKKGHKEGLEEGCELGRELERAEKNTSFVSSLLEDGTFTIPKIARLAGVSVSFVKEIKKKMEDERA